MSDTYSRTDGVRMSDALYFDGKDDSKWDAWAFKMLAYAAKKGHKQAFLKDYVFASEDEEDWTEDEKSQKVLMEAAWSQLALMVQGHALKSVIKVRSENPKEAWDKLKAEFEPSEIEDVVDLNASFLKLKLDSPKENPTEWIEKLEYNNERVGMIEERYLKDDFLLITHIFSLLPKEEYQSYITTEKKDIKNLSMVTMKKSVLAHWKQFIKSETKEEDAFYGEQKKTSPKSSYGAKKKFKGTCRKCGKQGHKAADCRGDSSQGSGSGGSGGGDKNKNKDVTCYKCQEKGHYARECKNEKKEKTEYSLFCGAVVAEDILSEEDEVSLSEGDDDKSDADNEWNFVGYAGILDSKLSGNDDSEEESVVSDDSMPELFFRSAMDFSDEESCDEQSSVPELITKLCFGVSFDDESDEDDDDSVPDLLPRNTFSSKTLPKDTKRIVVVWKEKWQEALLDLEDGPENVFSNEEEVHSSVGGDVKTDKNVVKWLLDTGASINAETSSTGVRDVKPCNSVINIADGKSIKPKGVGAMTLTDYETGYPLPIKKMHVIPEFTKRILSVAKLIDDGYRVEFLPDHATIKDKTGKAIKCPRDPAGLYYLHAKETESCNSVTDMNTSTWKDVKGEVNPDTGKTTTDTIVAKMPKTLDINHAHDVCGHKGEALLRKTYKMLGVELTGVMKPCEGCGYTKAKAKAVSKTTLVKASKPGERLFLDTTGPFSPTLNGYKYWIQVVDDFSRHGFCEFNKSKTGMGAFIRRLIVKLRALDMTPKYLRCDNAQEHLRDMIALCEEFAMTLEITAPNTPQQNAVVERRIVILKQRAGAMMIAANLVKSIRELLWHEAVNCANDLENISASSIRDKFPSEMMTGKQSKLHPMLQPFGRIAYVTIRQKFKATWKEKSVKHIVVGYAKNHSSDTYRMYNPVTKKVSETRDVGTWGEWNRIDPKSDMSVFVKDPALLIETMGLEIQEFTETFAPPDPDRHLIPDDSTDSEAGRKKPGEQITSEPDKSQDKLATGKESSENKARKLERELKKLDSSWNPIAKPSMDKATIIVEDDDGVDVEKEVHFVFNTELMTDHGDPKTFRQAMLLPDAVHWKDASGNEAMNFIKRGSWRKILREDVRDKGGKIIGTRWVYKKKDEQDGSVRYKGRIVSLGYMQIPGVDYTKSFSPVGNDTSVRVIIVYPFFMIIGQLK